MLDKFFSYKYLYFSAEYDLTSNLQAFCAAQLERYSIKADHMMIKLIEIEKNGKHDISIMKI